jgi:hypothetical protein
MCIFNNDLLICLEHYQKFSKKLKLRDTEKLSRQQSELRMYWEEVTYDFNRQEKTLKYLLK